MRWRWLCVGIALLSCSPARAEPPADFPAFVTQMKLMARESGIRDEVIDAAFADLQFIERAVDKDRSQPEFKITLDDYLKSRVPGWKIDKGRALYLQHKALLDEIGSAFGVQPRFIVAIWGMESNFGTYNGNYPIFSSLMTMAYDGRRAHFFRSELMAALQIVNDGHATVEQMKGSWAGAVGQTQFMPRSFFHFAVDYDGDGRKDIWNTPADVFASIANYLKQSGWDANLTWGREVRVPAEIDRDWVSLKRSQSLSAWQALGVRRLDGGDLPSRELPASLVQPDDSEGRSFLAYENFKVLLKWNRSSYFACSVGLMSDALHYW